MKIAFIVLIAVILMVAIIFILLLVNGNLSSVVSSVISIVTGQLKLSVGG